MKHILLILLTLGLTACGTTSTTTTTKYDADGNITEVIVVESDVSDFGSLIARGEGKATAMTLSATQVVLGQSGFGFLSVSGTSTTAPSTEETSADVLEASAEVIKATQTTVSTESIAVNADLADSSTQEAESE